MSLPGYNPTTPIGPRRLILQSLIRDEGYDVIFERLQKKCGAYVRQNYKMPCNEDVDYMTRYRDEIVNPAPTMDLQETEQVVAYVPREAAAQNPQINAIVEPFFERFGVRMTRIPWQQRDTVLCIVASLLLLGALSTAASYVDWKKFLIDVLVYLVKRGLTPADKDPNKIKNILQETFPTIYNKNGTGIITNEDVARNLESGDAPPIATGSKVWYQCAAWMKNTLPFLNGYELPPKQ